MVHPRKTLFAPVVKEENLNPTFRRMMTQPTSVPGRWMLDNVYSTFDDPDGNFLEQFQTTGFDTRYFELYLYAYFTRSGFTLDRSHPNPDFIVSRNGEHVAVEATTVNPATSGVVEKYGKKIQDLTPEEVQEYQLNELCIRFGSPLFSKLQKAYWKLEHCRDIPFVIAIEAFHDDGSLGFSSHSLSRYVFGQDQTGKWTSDGKLAVHGQLVSEHKLGDKTIPSCFFAQAGSENVSAVVFTNSGTHAKFQRMGFQHGLGNDSITMIRRGYCWNPQADAMDPTFFSYDLDCPPVVESWGQGLVVLHNPKCLRPVSREFFADAAQCWMEDGIEKTEGIGWHPMTSQTFVTDLGDAKAKLMGVPYRSPSFAIGAITKKDFQEVSGIIQDGNPLFTEQGWYADDTYAFLGVLACDKTDGDWGYVVLARDLNGQFNAIDNKVSISSRQEALQDLHIAIAKLLSKPKRFFGQEDEPERQGGTT